VKFAFRLDPVLRLRVRDEETAKRLLGLEVAAEQRERDVFQALQDDLKAETDAQQQAREGVIWAQGQALFLEWSQGQNLRIAQQRKVIAEAAQEVEKARIALIEARRAVQVLEKLKERRFTQWKLDLSRKEQAFASDVAAQRWMRLRSAGA
jgi:flagellar FliJ protein